MSEERIGKVLAHLEKKIQLCTSAILQHFSGAGRKTSSHFLSKAETLAAKVREILFVEKKKERLYEGACNKTWMPVDFLSFTCPIP
jgi:hypothetical protein